MTDRAREREGVTDREREGEIERMILFSSLQPQGSGKRLPEVYCIVSPLGCFSLYEKVRSVQYQ